MLCLEVFLLKGILKICSKFTGKKPMSKYDFNKVAKLQTAITFWHGRSPVNLLHILRISLPKNTYGGQLSIFSKSCNSRIIQSYEEIYKFILSSIDRVQSGLRCPYFTYTAQKMKFSVKDFFSKCDQIRKKLRIWSHLLK